MSALTNYAELSLAKHLVGLTTWTKPTTTYLALHTGDPGEVGNVAEAAGGSYARQAITWTWNTGTLQAESSGDITFTNPAAGTYTHFSVCDAATTGNVLFKGALTPSQVVNGSQNVVVLGANLTLTLD